jgi:hypothetical protein
MVDFGRPDWSIHNLKRTFFDPLLAVFVDHPDKWTTASWARAVA